MSEFRITKQACQDSIGDRICSSCGGKIDPIETVDNADNPTYWTGCLSCSVFDWGTTKEIFSISKILVLEKHYVHYSHLMSMPLIDDPNYNHWVQSQLRGTCGLIQQALNIQKDLAA